LIVRSHLESLRRNEQGTTAVEFAIVAPVFIALLVGTLAACQIAGIPDATLTQTYTQNHYFGPSVSPTFTYAAAACGNSVSASISYSMNVGFRTFTIPISATSCFP
jgi:Flp pilus assembly pilin Flp